MQRPGPNAGFTLLEIMIALTIMALVAVNITMVTRTGSQAARSGAFWQTLNDEADQTLDRITLALMSSDADNLYPIAIAPLYTNEVTYSVSLGVENGEVITSSPESISWEQQEDRGRVRWFENPGLPDERSVTWSNWVPMFFAGETFNGEDDNENAVVDETGLAFDMQGELVNVHLTIERQGPEGEWLPTTRSVQVTCRN
ncbi:MAG: prepilin-type N-terminal cleavage/methylation domain-containing protein [Planctomycetota bacterium]|nr:prepilin-type N-terminal cleavage/methylation domain-containing protein [Planctomycetota bacterium]